MILLERKNSIDSGHGGQLKDETGKEEDGYDERESSSIYPFITIE